MHSISLVCSQRSRRFHRMGMSLIELMVVVAIIAILAGLLLPAIQKIRTTARRLQSINNLKQMTIAAHNFTTDHAFLPPILGWDNPANKPADNGANGTVFFLLLPYMEYNNFYQKFYGPLDKKCSATDPTPKPVGVAAYRANRISLTTGLNSYPKEFKSPLDKSGGGWGVPATLTSYVANRDLLEKRIGIEKVSNGASHTMLFTEGLQTCKGNVWDPFNYNFSGGTTSYTYIWNGISYGPYAGTINGSSFQVSRTNNWAVGTEIWNRDAGALVTNATVQDYTDPNNPKSVVLDIQATDYAQGCSGCCYCYGGCGTIVNGAANTRGAIPAFFSPSYPGQPIGTYYEPWSNFSISQSITNTVTQGVPGTPTIVSTPTITPLTNPLRATYQDGRSPHVNPAMVLPGNTAPPTDCFWFGAQAHYNDLLAAMLDGSVHSINKGVTADSFNAAILPYTTGVPVDDSNFFDD